MALIDFILLDTSSMNMTKYKTRKTWWNPLPNINNKVHVFMFCYKMRWIFSL